MRNKIVLSALSFALVSFLISPDIFAIVNETLYAPNTDDTVRSRHSSCKSKRSNCSIREAIDEAHDLFEEAGGALKGRVEIQLVGKSKGVYVLDRKCDEERGGYFCNDLDLAVNIAIKGDQNENSIIDLSKLGDRAFEFSADRSGQQVFLYNLVIRNGSKPNAWGGAIFVNSQDTLVGIYYCLIGSNSADTGGAVAFYGSGGNFQVVGSKFRRNSTTSGPGGAIYATTGTLSVTNSEFTENSSSNQGGAIHLVGNASAQIGSVASFPVIPKTKITDNTARFQAGGLYLGANAKATLDTIELFGNTSTSTNNNNCYVGSSSSTALTSSGNSKIGADCAAHMTTSPSDEIVR